MPKSIVYLIDDDPTVLHSTAFLLQSLGIRAQAFLDPREFLAAVDGLEPGCVVTDLRMPHMNGSEVRQALLARSVDWPVVLMTSEDGAINEKTAASFGFAGFLGKPFSADRLLAVLAPFSAAARNLDGNQRERPAI